MLKEHISQHNFRNCNQRLYFSGQRFRQHLQDNHKTNYDGTLFAGWALLLKSSKKERPAVFEAVEGSVGVRRTYTDSEVTSAKASKKQEVPQVPRMNFMDLSETPEPKKKLHRKASSQTMPERPAIRETRNSVQIFTRAATVDLAYGTNASLPSPQATKPPEHKQGFPTSSLPMDSANMCPRFYRRRLDASTRNRLYVRDPDQGPLSKNSQRLFRKVPGSAFGGLVLHSSLVAAVPARLTNSVDVYSLH